MCTTYYYFVYVCGMEIQKNLEDTMISKIKDLGFVGIRIHERLPSGYKKVTTYTYLRSAVKRLIKFADGEFPIYQDSCITKNGYKMIIGL